MSKRTREFWRATWDIPRTGESESAEILDKDIGHEKNVHWIKYMRENRYIENFKLMHVRETILSEETIGGSDE